MFGLISDSTRPNRFDKDIDINSEQYHVDMARYCIDAGFNQQRENWLQQYYLNLNFFFDNQWIIEEDLELFLKATSGQSKNRIKQNHNKIYPIVAQFIGNAKTMDVTVRASALSSKAVTRREEKLEELYLFNDIADNAPPQIGNEIRDKFGLGRDKKETELLFNNLWQDNYIKVINALMIDIAEKNDFKNKQGTIGKYMSLSGLGLLKYQEYNGGLVWNTPPVDIFFFDNSAQEYDLSDAEFMGEAPKMLPSVIYEKWDVKLENKKVISDAVRVASQQTSDVNYISGGKIPVYHVYWKDSISSTYGYVKDEFGYVCFMELDKKEEGQENPQYTDKDLIPYKDLNETQRKMCNGNAKTQNNKTTKWVDVIRFCEIIPREVVSSAIDKSNKTGDIVLKYGIMPYQDTEYYKYSSTRFPFKCNCWIYSHGTISTPVSMLINPQRMINRNASVAENLVNCSMPKVPIYDKSMITDEAQLLSDWYEGKPLGLDARGVGIGNALGMTQSSLDANALKTYIDLMDFTEKGMWSTTGVNESLLGQSQGSEQLVGVTALQIQRGSLIQEPFYSAVANIFEQAYKTNANVGKRIYADNKKELSISVGDDGVEIIKVTKDIKTEDFRISIHREPSIEQQKALANQTLDKLIQMQLINDIVYADLYNRSTPDEVAMGIRKYAKEKMLMAKATQEQQGKMEQMQAEQIQKTQDQEMTDKINARNDTLAINASKKETALDVADKQLLGKMITSQNKQQGQQK